MIKFDIDAERNNNMGNEKASKRKYSPNFIDIILIIVILCGVALLAYIFLSGSSDSESDAVSCQIEYKICVKTVRKTSKGAVNIGDIVKDSKGRYALGEVINVTYEPYYLYTVEENSMEMVRSEHPDLITMVITAKTNAVLKDNTYYVDECELHVGSKVEFRTFGYYGSGNFTDLKEYIIEEEAAA